MWVLEFTILKKVNRNEETTSLSAARQSRVERLREFRMKKEKKKKDFNLDKIRADKNMHN